MRNTFFRKFRFLVPLILLAVWLIPAATPVNASTIPVICTASDYTTGATAEYIIKIPLATQLGPSDWVKVNIPYGSYQPGSVEYTDSTGKIQTLYGYGWTHPWKGGSPEWTTQLLIRNGSGPTLPSGTMLIMKFTDVVNPVAGGIYTITVTTYYPGTNNPGATNYGAVKDSGQAVMRLGRYAYATSGASSSVKISGTSVAAQTITSEVAHRITSLRLKLYRAGSPGTLSISIEQTSGSLPNGTVLSSGTLDTSTVTNSTSGDWYTVPLSASAPLSVGTHYAIVLRALSGDAANQVFWRTTISGDYAGGFVETSTNSGTTWSPSPVTDCLFEEYGSLPYAVSVLTSGSGTVTKSPNQQYYAAGQPITLTATPAAGWHLSSWQVARTDTGDSGPLLPPLATLNFQVTESLNITANFEINSYPLTVNIQGDGTVDINPLQTTYIYGTPVQLTATPTPDTGYWFAGWSSSHNATNPITITMDGPKVVNAIFSNGGYLELAYTGNGQVWAQKTSDGSLISGPCPSGTPAVIIALPDEGWHLDHFEYTYWQYDKNNYSDTVIDIGENGWLNLTINSLTKVKVVFSDTYHLDVAKTEGGTISPAVGEDYSYIAGSIVTLSATPDPGWHFVNWDITYSNGFYYEDSNQYSHIIIDQDTSVKAIFAKSETNFNITTANGSVTVEPSPGPYTSTVTPSVKLTATPNDGWKFDHWYLELPLNIGSSITLYDILESPDNPLNVQIKDYNSGTVKVTAYFVPDISSGFTLNVKTDGHGTATRSPAQASYDNNDVVNLSAIPATGYHFVNWTGAAVAGANSASTTITMQGNYIVQANFANDPPTISTIDNQTTQEDTAISGLAFTAADTETAAGSLVITKACSNTSLIPLSNIVAGGSGSNRTLAITPAPNRSGTANIIITVRDGQGARTSETFQVTVNPVNDAPSGTDKTATAYEDTNYIFTEADFGFRDPLDNPANSLYAVKVATLSTSGTLKDDGVEVSAGQFISAANISGGKFTFSPAADENGSLYTSFTFQVQDDGGTDKGGLDLDPSAKTLTVNVIPVNDPPSFTAGSDQTVSATAGDQTISGWATDISPGPQDESEQTLGFSVTNDNTGLFAIQPAVDAISGDLTFTPNTGARGSALINVTLYDNGDTTNGGQNISAEQTFTITVIQPNSKPTAEALDLSMDEDTTLEITLGGSDAEATDLTFIIVDNPALGTLSGITDAEGISGDPNTDCATLTYTPPANYYGNVSFTYKVRDAGDGSEAALESNPVTVNITVYPVIDSSSVDLVSSVNPALEGQSVRFTAIVSSTAGTPTGSVTFKDETTVLATLPLTSGKAVYSTRGLHQGIHSITAEYNGDDNFEASISPVLNQTIRYNSYEYETDNNPPEGSTSQVGITDGNGNFNSTVRADSSDKLASVSILSGTSGKAGGGAPLVNISITPYSNAAKPAMGIGGVGLVYSYGPEGAIFSQPITITLHYSLPLPEGLSEDGLYIAYFNPVTNQWEELSPSIVDKVNHTVSVQVNHFSLYQIQGVLTVAKPTPTPSVAPAPVVATSTPFTPEAAASPVPSLPATTSAAPATSPLSEPAAPFNWVLVIVIAAAAVLAALLIIFRRQLFQKN